SSTTAQRSRNRLFLGSAGVGTPGSGIDQPRFTPDHLPGHDREVGMSDTLPCELEEVARRAASADELSKVTGVRRTVSACPGVEPDARQQHKCAQNGQKLDLEVAQGPVPAQ